jgi:hypothetical protein
MRRIAAGVLPAALAVMFLFAACEDGPAKKGGPPRPPGPDQVFVDARFVVTENGLTSAVVRADSVLVWNDRAVSEANGNLKVDFFSREGTRISTLTADRGIVYGMTEAIDSLRATGNVVVVWHERNAVMRTPFIRWIAAIHTIHADSTVVLTVENAAERGIGFTAPDDLKSYTMRSVSGYVQDENIKIPRVPDEK